jgi:iron-sulfur cluster assembly protein
MSQDVKTKQATDLPIAGQSESLVDLTDTAAAEVKRLIEAQKLEDHYLRIGVEGGGCSGLMYSLHLDNQVKDSDRVFEAKGVKLVCTAQSAVYLNGTKIDYITSMVGGGFKFINPNASRSCGCGSSFSA